MKYLPQIKIIHAAHLQKCALMKSEKFHISL